MKTIIISEEITDMMIRKQLDIDKLHETWATQVEKSPEWEDTLYSIGVARHQLRGQLQVCAKIRGEYLLDTRAAFREALTEYHERIAEGGAENV